MTTGLQGEPMPPEWLRDRLIDVIDATRFLSRLPLPGSDRAPAPLAQALRMAPLAGVLIASGPALALVVATSAGLPSLIAATLTLALLVLATGALHEDGWADLADGFGGGRTPARKLEIMRDSRIGTYGALALGLGLLVRVASLQALVAARGAGAAALLLVAAAVVSRAMMLVPLVLLRPARTEGLGHAAGAEGKPMLLIALALALPTTALLGVWAMPDRVRLLIAVLISAAAALAVTRLARNQIAGVTGDVVGAAQQAGEIAFLVILAADPRAP